MAADNTGAGNARTLLRQLSAFLLLGAVRTVLSYALYLALLQLLPYRIAFTVSYIITLVFSVFVNGAYVFRTQLTPLKVLRYGAVFCINYFLGLGVLTFAVAVLGLDEKIAPAVVIVVMFPVGFLTERYALTR